MKLPLGPAGLLEPLIRHTSAMAAMQSASYGLAFVLNLVLARWLGVAEFGIYSYVLSWIGVLGTLSAFGLDRILLRDVPVYCNQAAWSSLRGLLRWANLVALLASLVLLGVVFLLKTVAGILVQHPNPVVKLGGLLVPLTALAVVQTSTLRGLFRPAGSEFFRTVLPRLLMLILVAGAALLGIESLLATHALGFYALAAGITLLCGAIIVRRLLPGEVRTAAAIYHSRDWAASSFQMFLITGLASVNGKIDVLVLGMLAGPEAVGAYSAALRGAILIPMALHVANAAMAPAFASLHAEGRKAGLQHLVSRMSLLSLALGTPVAVGMILFGHQFLLLFGREYTGGRTALILLSIGQWINVAAGPVANLLTMTGHERDAVVGIGISTGANLALSLLLIPLWGMNGAALAGAASLILWNGVLFYYVRRRMGIFPSILGAFRSS